MPLVLLCGFPCSGKSKRAQEIANFFTEKGVKTTIISDERPNFRTEVFKESKTEKDFRSELKSDVQRLIAKDTVTILDSGNYIKGYRYELYCMSKASKTTQCVIHCDTPEALAWEWNIKRDSNLQYEKEIFYGLIQRFECPESKNRWDSPLFIAHHNEPLPFEDINDALFSRKAPPPNQATQNQPLSASNFLYDLDRITQDVIKVILDAQKSGFNGEITIPNSTEKFNSIDQASPAALSKLRRQFITYTKMHPVDNSEKIPTMFVHYLNCTI